MYKLHLKSSKSSIFLFLGIVLMPFSIFLYSSDIKKKKITQIIVSFHLRSAAVQIFVFLFCKKMCFFLLNAFYFLSSTVSGLLTAKKKSC